MPSLGDGRDSFDGEFRVALESAVRHQLAGHDIARVDLGWKVDFEGEDFLSVDVVIADDILKYSGSSLSGLTGKLRKVLGKFSVHAFPLVRFLSKSEADEVAA